MNRKTTEDYLKAIYEVDAVRIASTPGVNMQGVSTNDLAARLGVAPASVTGMLKKLAAEELVTYAPYQGVDLTAAGRRIALDVVRRHRLAERYLQDILGLSWDQVHAEAEEWEHVLSDRVTAAMDEALGGPSVDPHGEPIPSEEGRLPALADRPLAQLHPNDAATVARVSNDDGDFLRYIGALGLYPRALVSVIDVAPFDGPVTIEVQGKRGAIGRRAAEQVFVVDVHAAEGGPAERGPADRSPSEREL